MSTYLLGIDVSTTATKALLIDDAGAVIAVAATEYPFETPQPLWTEQDAALFWDGTVQSVRAVLAKTGINPADIAGVGLSGQMHGLVTLDAAGQPLRPCILWNDQRTARPVRRDHGTRRPRARAPAHRQPRAHRLHRAEGAVGAAERAGDLRPHRAHAAAQGLRALQAHRRVLQRSLGCLGHVAVRRGPAPLVGRDAGCARHPARLAAGSHGVARRQRTDQRRGGRRDRPGGGHAGGGRRRG